MSRFKVNRFVIAAFFVLALASPVPLTQAQTDQGLEATPPAPPTEQIIGQIFSVDPQAAKIVVEFVTDQATQAKAQETLFTDAKSEFLRDDQVIQLTDLKPNDKVSVEYYVAFDNSKVITTVWVEN